MGLMDRDYMRAAPARRRRPLVKYFGLIIGSVFVGSFITALTQQGTTTSTSSTSPAALMSNAACPHPLTNKIWANVSLRPDRYVGCSVDVAANLSSTETLDGYVSFNSQLDPYGPHDWTVFALDSADAPPQIADDATVEIRGTIKDSAQAQNRMTGAFTGYVPEITVTSIQEISNVRARALGMTLSS
jgi:hypothetical protein